MNQNFRKSDKLNYNNCNFLATRYNYDSMHTERYMNLPEANRDGYFACSILNQNLENMKNKQYTIIAGTADDNVHFQNAAQISKAFIGVGAEIKAQVRYNKYLLIYFNTCGV